MGRDLHVGHVQLDVLDEVSQRAPVALQDVVDELGGLCASSRGRAKAAALALLRRGLLSRRAGRLHLSPGGTTALSRALAGGRHPGVPGGPRSYGRG